MKTFLECIPCFMTQALRAGKLTTKDDVLVKKILDEVGGMIREIELEDTPPEIGAKIYNVIKQITGIDDPYKDIKKENIAEAMKLYPELKKIVAESSDPLLTAIRIAIAGNVIDLGVNVEFNIVEDMKTILKQDFAVFDYGKFKEMLSKADSILYLGDNSGEGVFDRILIETLDIPVTFVVREIPIINDITFSEARIIGLDKVATEIISSGSRAPATILNMCHEEFIKRFDEADLVISKGQGNYEGLSGVNRSVTFLLKAKCPVIATHIGVPQGSIVFQVINP